MSGVIRFHLDESADGRIARSLRRRGMDVSTPVDAGLLASDDEAHLNFARQQRRVVITQDADFLALHRAGREHSGIVYYRPGKRALKEIVSSLCLLHDCVTAEEMDGRVQYF
jgi:predicted nuclease of predicted toxin-antitoxin system